MMALKRSARRSGKGEERPRKFQAKATVSIVGAGRLGTALALALASRGYTVESLVARRKLQARTAARVISANFSTHPRALASSELDELPSSDILFITTLAAIFLERRQVHGRKKGDHAVATTALHASGALSSAALRRLRAAGFHTGSMHPLVSVSDSLQGAESLSSAFFCVEGDAAAKRVALRIVRALGAKSFSISSEDKALYHAAAVVTSGHTTALFDLALEMLARCGITRRRARAVLLPLLKSTFENLTKSDPLRALTGTFRRADSETVKRHLFALRERGMTDALAAYALLGRRSLELARAAGASREALRKIERELAAASRWKLHQLEK